MSEWKQYRRTNIAQMRPIVFNENIEKMSISAPDAKLSIDEFYRGFVARNPQNHDEQWYVARAYFDANFEPITADEDAFGEQRKLGTDHPSND